VFLPCRTTRRFHEQWRRDSGLRRSPDRARRSLGDPAEEGVHRGASSLVGEIRGCPRPSVCERVVRVRHLVRKNLSLRGCRPALGSFRWDVAPGTWRSWRRGAGVAPGIRCDERLPRGVGTASEWVTSRADCASMHCHAPTAPQHQHATARSGVQRLADAPLLHWATISEPISTRNHCPPPLTSSLNTPAHIHGRPHGPPRPRSGQDPPPRPRCRPESATSTRARKGASP